MTRLATVQDLMRSFARATGLIDASAERRRYLWTDAFAVCNFLAWHAHTGESEPLDLALQLVDQVHTVLGRHRPDSQRQGWLSGLSDTAAQQHPTAGGLRIGKPLPERRPDEPYDAAAEWDRDGQYFHYLTKWMHALNAVTRATGDPRYNLWAIELAKVAHAAFTYQPYPGSPWRMYWKLSTDLSYPLVPAMGQHDPLDGLITYQILSATQQRLKDAEFSPDLTQEITLFKKMCAGATWTSDDPLGIGGLLSNAHHLLQLIVGYGLDEAQLLGILLHDSDVSLSTFPFTATLQQPAAYRLGFRELGLAIGLQAIERMQTITKTQQDTLQQASTLTRILDDLARYAPYHQRIEAYWLSPEHQAAATWTEHHDINTVMLATSLLPDGYLDLT